MSDEKSFPEHDDLSNQNDKILPFSDGNNVTDEIISNSSEFNNFSQCQDDSGNLIMKKSLKLIF